MRPHFQEYSDYLDLLLVDKPSLERTESLNPSVSQGAPEESEEQMDHNARAKQPYIIGADDISALPLDWRKDSILWPFQTISDNDNEPWKDLPDNCTDVKRNTTTYALAGFFTSASRRKLDQALVDEVRRIIRESKWMASRKHEHISELVMQLQMKAVEALTKRVEELEGFRKALTSKP